MLKTLRFDQFYLRFDGHSLWHLIILVPSKGHWHQAQQLGFTSILLSKLFTIGHGMAVIMFLFYLLIFYLLIAVSNP